MSPTAIAHAACRDAYHSHVFASVQTYVQLSLSQLCDISGHVPASKGKCKSLGKVSHQVNSADWHVLSDPAVPKCISAFQVYTLAECASGGLLVADLPG